MLNAILLLKKMAYEEPYRNKEEDVFAKCNIKAIFKHSSVKVKLDATLEIITNERNVDIVTTRAQRWTIIPEIGAKKDYNIPLWYLLALNDTNQNRLAIYYFRNNTKERNYNIPDTDLQILKDIVLDISEIRYYSASQFTNPSNCPVSIESGHRDRVSHNPPSTHAKFLQDLYSLMNSADKARYNQFIDVVGQGGIGLIDEIAFEDIKTSSINFSVKIGGKIQEKTHEKRLIVPKFKISKNVLSPNQLSEGTFRTITLLFYLITESSQLLLIEEPEVCIHHGLLTSILELIKSFSKERQIVITTHSDFVLDYVLPRNVYIVKRSREDGTNVSHVPKSMTRKELASLMSYLDKEGNLGEYWKHGGLEL